MLPLDAKKCCYTIFFNSLLLRSVAFTYSISTRITKRRITWTGQFRKNERSKIKARAPSGRSPVPFLGKGLRPPALEGRARALSTTANHGISLFFKGNPRFDQGKSCSVPRVWQLCKISARSVPVSKSYDRNEFYITFWNSPLENFGLHEAYVNRSARQRGGYFRDSS